jgi:hypothetical protein
MEKATVLPHAALNEVIESSRAQCKIIGLVRDECVEIGDNDDRFSAQ